MILVFGVPVIVGAWFVSLTVILNEGKEVFLILSLTEITMFDVVPTSALLGVPLSFPVTVSNDAQLGLLVILKVSVSVLS